MRSRAKKKGGEREGRGKWGMRRRGGESNKGQEKGTEGRGGGGRRAQSGAICTRPMNEIFISEKEETGCFCLLTLALSPSSTWTYSSSLHPSFPSSPLSAVLFSLCLSLSSCILPPLLCVVSPLVEDWELFLSPTLVWFSWHFAAGTTGTKTLTSP